MQNFLYNLVIGFVFLAIGQVGYLKIDKHLNITDKITIRIPVKEDWKPMFNFWLLPEIIFVVAFLVVNIIKLPGTVSSVLLGLSLGLISALKRKIPIRKIQK